MFYNHFSQLFSNKMRFLVYLKKEREYEIKKENTLRNGRYSLILNAFSALPRMLVFFYIINFSSYFKRFSI